MPTLLILATFGIAMTAAWSDEFTSERAFDAWLEVELDLEYAFDAELEVELYLEYSFDPDLEVELEIERPSATGLPAPVPLEAVRREAGLEDDWFDFDDTQPVDFIDDEPTTPWRRFSTWVRNFRRAA